MNERDVERYLVQRVKDAGGEIRKVRFIGRRGAPDRLVMLPGITLWIEVKRPGGKTKPHQDREHARMTRMGQEVLVVDSRQAIDKLFKGPKHGSKKKIRR